MKRISKREARNLYDKGMCIYLLPCKIEQSVAKKWLKPRPIIKERWGDFDTTVRVYEYYYCEGWPDLGSRAIYFIEEDK